MKVLTRYLLRSHIPPFFFAFLALTGVVLINTLARELANLAGKGLQTRIFFEFFLLSLPANVALTLPMSMLVAVLYTFSQMAQENEITALRASGIDLRRMVVPLLVAATLIALGMVWFNDRVLPAANYRWRMLMTDVAETTPLLLLHPHVINPINNAGGGTQYYLEASRIEPGANRLGDVTIYDISDPDASRTIYADSAFTAWNETRTDLVLTLFDGHIRQVDLSQPENFQQIGFRRQVLRIPGVAQQMRRSDATGYRTDRDMTIEMMQASMDTLRKELRDVRASQAKTAPQATAGRPVPPSAGVSSLAAPYDSARIQGIQTQMREYEVEIQKKYSIAAATLVFVLIGVPLALRFARGGVGMVIGASLLIFSIYYVGLIGGETLADKGFIPPAVAMWQTNVLFGVLGLLGMWRVGREQSTGRGSGWADLPRWLRWPMVRRTGGPVEA